MSLLQINTAIPLALAQPLLEQHEGRITERKTATSSRKGEYSSITTNQYRTKFIVLGALTGFFIQVVSLGAYAFLLVHYQFQQGQQHEFEEDNNDASTTTTTTSAAALISGFLKQQQNENGNENESSSAIQMPYYSTDTIMYTLLSALTQIDLIVYVLIWIAFTCTMTKNGMSCIRSSLFASTTQEEQTATTATTSTTTATNTTTTNDSKKKKKKIKIIKRRYVFVLGVNFLIGIVLGAFIAWSIIDIYLGFPIPLKPILFTVLIDLMLCYFMICCYDMGSSSSNSSSKSNGRSKKSKNNKRVEVVENDDNDSDTDDNDTDDDDDDDNDDDDEDSSSWC
jgi:F0F1-type ATP synthase assembly protein I